jgi:hypothetical protein
LSQALLKFSGGSGDILCDVLLSFAKTVAYAVDGSRADAVTKRILLKATRDAHARSLRVDT